MFAKGLGSMNRSVLANMFSMGPFTPSGAPVGSQWQGAAQLLGSPFAIQRESLKSSVQLCSAQMDECVKSSFRYVHETSARVNVETSVDSPVDRASSVDIAVRSHAQLKRLAKNDPGEKTSTSVAARDIKQEIVRAVKRQTARVDGPKDLLEGIPAGKVTETVAIDPRESSASLPPAMPDVKGRLPDVKLQSEPKMSVARDGRDAVKGSGAVYMGESVDAVHGFKVDARSMTAAVEALDSAVAMSIAAGRVSEPITVTNADRQADDAISRAPSSEKVEKRVRMTMADATAKPIDDPKQGAIETPRFGFPAAMNLPKQSRHSTSAAQTSGVRGGMTMRPRGFKTHGVFSAQQRMDDPAQTMIIEKRSGDVTVRAHYVEYQGKMHFAGVEEVQSPLKQSADKVARALMAPLTIRDNRPRAFGFGKPGGETAPDLSGEYEQTPVDERLATMLIFQLRQDPKTLADDRIRTSFNVHLMAAGHHEGLSREQWDHFLTSTMTAAVRHAPLMKGDGLSSIADIQRAASHVLGMSPDRFSAWQEHLGVESISEHLFAGVVGAQAGVELSQVGEQLLKSVEQHIAALASNKIDMGELHFAVPRKEEIAHQWSVARLSIVTDAKRKVNEAVALVGAVANRNVHGAARMLAMVVRHSELNEEPVNEDALAPRWTRGDVAALVNALIKGEAAPVVSHRSFRQYLEPRQNRAINVAIHEANYVDAIDEVAKVDVMEMSDDAFWALLDETGAEETIMDAALERMMKNDIEIPLDEE